MLHLIECLALLAQTVLAGRSAAQGSDMLRSSICCGATPQSLGRVMASPWQLPNPNSQHARCNILGPGGLCDPDGILSPHGRNRILDVLIAIRQETSLTCPDGKEHGYQMAVLLVQQMDRSSDVLKGLSIEKASEQFATEVGNMWKVGDKGCNNGIMMFLSIWDRFAYIKTTHTTQNILSESDTGQVAHNMRPLLRNERYYEAILQGVVQVKGVLMGNHIRNDKGLNLFQSCVLGVILAFLFISVVLRSFFMCLVGCLYAVLVTLLCLPMAVIADALTACCHRKKQISQIEQAQAQEDLQRVAKELDRDEFDQTICPICLDHLEEKSRMPSENLQVDTSRGVLLPFNGVGFPMEGEHGQETKTLQCKHKYHKQCVEEWLVQHSSCPLCRSDVSDVSLADEDAKQPESYQRRLRFYLSRVQANHRSVFGSFNTFHGTFDPPLMYQRHASTGQVCVSDWYLNGYGYESGNVDSFHSHLASAQSLVMDWADMSVHGFGGGGGFDGDGGWFSSDFGGGGGFDGGGGGGGGW